MKKYIFLLALVCSTASMSVSSNDTPWGKITVYETKESQRTQRLKKIKIKKPVNFKKPEFYWIKDLLKVKKIPSTNTGPS